MNRLSLAAIAAALLISTNAAMAQRAPNPGRPDPNVSTQPATQPGGEGIRVIFNGREVGPAAGEPRKPNPDPRAFQPGQPLPPGAALPPGAPMIANVRWGQPKMEKVTYLGVTTSPLPESLQVQLSLPKGVGQVVEFTDPDGAAAKAGLEKHDVLLKLDDQWVINAPQLQVLVRMHKSGDEVKLTVLRKTKEQVIPAKLIEKDMPAHETVMDGRGWFQQPGMQPRGGMDHEMIERMMQERGGVHVGMGGPGGMIEYSDKEYIYTPSTRDGRDYLVIKDRKSGNVVFDGPIATEEQRKKVPDGLLNRYQDFRGKFNVRVNEGNPYVAPGAATGTAPAGWPVLRTQSRPAN